jgi:HPt (histidine-containing phosphotransfer) domain-containing protein
MQPTPPARPEEVIAPIHLEELRSMREILPSLISTLRKDVSLSISQILSGLALGNLDTIARAAHGIAGAAGSVGGQRLAALCRQLETDARTKNAQGAGTLLPAIETEYTSLCDALELVAQETH